MVGVLLALGLALGAAAQASADVAPPSSPEPYVVFTVGDSYASGEGAPQVNGVYDSGGDTFVSGFRPEDWDANFSRTTQEGVATERCHRSPLSTSGVATGYLDEDFPDIDVVFQSVACSGASIVRGGVLDRNNPADGNLAAPNTGGVLRGYAGADGLSDFDPRPQRPVFPAQLNQIDDRLNAGSPDLERLDALIMGIGGNDAGFATYVAACADVLTKESPGGNCTTDTALITFRNKRLGFLPGRYDRLAGSLESNKRDSDDAELDSNHQPQAVLLTGIPEIARKSGTRFCDREPTGDQTAKVTSAEARFVEDTVRVPLNTAMKEAAQRHGWVFVDDHINDFAGHAICQAAADRWINTNNDGLRKQGDLEDTDIGFGLDIPLPDFSGGWAHPNSRGFSQIGGSLYRDLAAQLVRRFTPESVPVVAVFNQPSRVIALFPSQAEGVRATRSGNYRAIRLVQVGSDGRNSPVAGADAFRLLGYSDSSAAYDRTGRYLALARSCAPVSRDASVGCGPARVLRLSTVVPTTPALSTVVARAAAQSPRNGLSGVRVTWSHINPSSAHDTTSSRVRVTGTLPFNGSFDRTFTANGRRTAVDVGSLTFGNYSVSVEACNQNVGCSPPTTPVSIDTGQIADFDPDAIRIGGYVCDRAAISWGAPQRVLPARNGTGGSITLLDSNSAILPGCLDEPVGRLSVAPRSRTVRPGRPAGLTVGWEHPSRWSDLRTVQVRLRSGSQVVATLTFNQDKQTIALARGAGSGGQRARLPSRSRRTLRAGAVKLLLDRSTFRRPTARAHAIRLRPRLVFGRGLAGRSLSVEIAASGDDGERQAFAVGGAIRVLRR
jgi:hypothetical protein